MTLSFSTSLTVSAIPFQSVPFADVRCQTCKRLLLRWQFQGFARIEVKCPRCGSIDMIHLSTS